MINLPYFSCSFKLLLLLLEAHLKANSGWPNTGHVWMDFEWSTYVQYSNGLVFEWQRWSFWYSWMQLWTASCLRHWKSILISPDSKDAKKWWPFWKKAFEKPEKMSGFRMAKPFQNRTPKVWYLDGDFIEQKFHLFFCRFRCIFSNSDLFSNLVLSWQLQKCRRFSRLEIFETFETKIRLVHYECHQFL